MVKSRSSHSSGGVDLVIELPTIYAISSAENYAEGAIKLLNSLGIVDHLAFGTETPNLTALNTIAEVLFKEPREYKNLLSHELQKGISYPKARENALMMYLSDIRKYIGILSAPNNILAIEYLKALKKYESYIKPKVIERMGAGHNDLGLEGAISSATAIRSQIAKGEQEALEKTMPTSSYSILRENISHGHIVPGLQTFEKEIIYTLRKMPIKDLKNLADVTEGLENLLKKSANSCNTLGELISKAHSKRITQTRLQRILLYSLLDITKKDMAISKKITPYARILGYNETGKKLIKKIVNTNPKIEFVTSVKRYLNTCPSKQLTEMLEIDLLATDIHTIGYQRDSKSNLDFTKKIITI